MIHRTALFIASLTAVLVLVVGFTVAGGGFAAPAGLAAVAATAQVASAPLVQVDTVYVAPPNVPSTVVVHHIAASAGAGENDGVEGD